jgi:outer membrane protein assembly factor BamB
MVMAHQSERFSNGQEGFPGWRVRVTSRRGVPTPAVVGGAVLFGGGFGSHEIYAVDAATGQHQWKYHTRDDGPTAASVLDGVALFNTESCTLMAIDAATGTRLWEKWLGDPLLAQPAAAGDRVLMAYPRSGSHWLGAFDLRQGTQRWEVGLGHDIISAPVTSDGKAYVSTYDGSVTCIDAMSGQIQWTRPMNATSAPWIAGDYIHVAQRNAPPSASSSWRADNSAPHASSYAPYERMVAMVLADAASMKAAAWKSAAYLGSDWGARCKAAYHAADAAVGFAHAPAASKMDHVRRLIGEGHVSRAWRFQGSRPIVVNGIAYDTTGDRLEARALDTGAVIWSWTDASAEEGERRLTPPAVANGRLLIGTWDGRLVSFDAMDGRKRWDVAVGAPCHWQPVMEGGRIFAGLEDGSLVAFETGDPLDDGWPMWGGGPGHNGPEPSRASTASASPGTARDMQDERKSRPPRTTESTHPSDPGDVIGAGRSRSGKSLPAKRVG